MNMDKRVCSVCHIKLQSSEALHLHQMCSHSTEELSIALLLLKGYIRRDERNIAKELCSCNFFQPTWVRDSFRYSNGQFSAAFCCRHKAQRAGMQNGFPKRSIPNRFLRTETVVSPDAVPPHERFRSVSSFPKPPDVLQRRPQIDERYKIVSASSGHGFLIEQPKSKSWVRQSSNSPHFPDPYNAFEFKQTESCENPLLRQALGLLVPCEMADPEAEKEEFCKTLGLQNADKVPPLKELSCESFSQHKLIRSRKLIPPGRSSSCGPLGSDTDPTPKVSPPRNSLLKNLLQQSASPVPDVLLDQNSNSEPVEILQGVPPKNSLLKNLLESSPSDARVLDQWSDIPVKIENVRTLTHNSGGRLQASPPRHSQSTFSNPLTIFNPLYGSAPVESLVPEIRSHASESSNFIVPDDSNSIEFQHCDNLNIKIEVAEDAHSYTATEEQQDVPSEMDQETDDGFSSLKLLLESGEVELLRSEETHGPASNNNPSPHFEPEDLPPCDPEDRDQINLSKIKMELDNSDARDFCNAELGESENEESEDAPEHPRLSLRVFKCQWCDRGYKKKSHLERHVRIHTGDKPYSCQFCSKAFSVRSVLQQHIRVHTGEKPFSCHICLQRFPQKSGLITHMMLHKGKPFKCDECDLSFVSNHKLINHLRVHTGNRPFVCLLCETPFSSQDALDAHTNACHNKEKKFFCDVCNASFLHQVYLQVHMQEHASPDDEQ